MTEAQIWQRWRSELDFAQKDKKYVDWLARADKIVARYRDQRKDAVDQARRRMNILWSNVETLRPAVYPKMPKPIVERRYMDRDPAARLASTILERCLSLQMEVGYYHGSIDQAVLDHLLAGMGQTWIRYEPKFEASEEGYENKQVVEGKTAEQIEEDGDGTPYEKLAYERVCVDYVYYRDFIWGSARFWNEVPWVGRRCWLTRSEIAEKFYGGDLEKAKAITLDYTPDRMKDKIAGDEASAGFFKKAELWEIWNKADQTAYFIPPGTPDVMLRIEPKPILKLEGFWPCSEPLFATQTNDTLVPVPDYVEYQDQAMELDDLTARIAALTTALRANGVYDASFPALARLLQDGQDNKLIPVDQWAQFAEKGGMKGAIDLVPIKEIADVLIGLYSARQQVKDDLYEVTGMSDIIRGQGAASETATAQRIKGQFASMRLEDRRGAVATFCRSNLKIMAEVISEIFSDESLMQMSGVDVMMKDDIRKAVESVPPPPPPEMPPPPEGMPPPSPQEQQAIMQKMQAQASQAHQQAQQQAAMAAQQKGMQEFQQAVKILRSDKLRGFRVDIETDQTISADAQADKQSAIELVQGTLQSLTEAGPVVMQAPELMKPIGGLLMFAFRRFRVGRTLEASLEDALDQMNDKIEAQKGQPPPPSPEEVKAQAEMAKQQAETERLQVKAQIEQQQAEAQLQADRQRNAMEMQALKAKTDATIQVAQMDLMIKQEELKLKEQEIALKEREMLIGAQIKALETAMQVDAIREQHDMDREAADHKHALGIETMDAKAQAAKQQAKAKPENRA